MRLFTVSLTGQPAELFFVREGREANYEFKKKVEGKKIIRLQRIICRYNYTKIGYTQSSNTCIA